MRPSIQANFSAMLSEGGRTSDAKAGVVFYESLVTHYPLLSHTEDGCSICEMTTKHSEGGRSRKERKNRGRPGENSMHTLCQHIYRLHPLLYGLSGASGMSWVRSREWSYLYSRASLLSLVWGGRHKPQITPQDQDLQQLEIETSQTQGYLLLVGHLPH